MSDFQPRRAKPHQVFGFTTFEGDQRELKADGNGVVRPQTSEDERILDGFDLPHVQAAARKKASSSKSSKKTTSAKAPAAPAKESAPPAEVFGPGGKPDGGNG